MHGFKVGDDAGIEIISQNRICFISAINIASKYTKININL